MQHETLLQILEANRDAKRSIHFLDGETDERIVPFGELHERALGVLADLQARGAKRGDKLIIFLNNNEQFIDGFWGAVAGGVIPVPLAVGISDEHRHKLLRIARLLGAPLLYTDRKNLERLGGFAATVGESATFEQLKARALLVEERAARGAQGVPVRVTPDDTAFIQFSSGSTSEPKGIVLTHGNLIANCRSTTAVAGFNDEDVALSWMPLTHDMGLIGKHIFMFANRIENHLMPTELFIRRPLLWPKFASDRRATILSSPNFGYRHFLKVLGERTLENVDLASVRLIFNGAEPISMELCDEFMGRMAPYGLARSAMYPVYGLAEATLAVTFPAVGSVYRARYFDRHRLDTGSVAGEVAAGAPNSLALIDVGRPLPNTEVRIAAEDRTALPPGSVGHVLIRGANVTKGYYAAPEINARMISADGWLDTGDLGVVIDGDLFITGRAKEVIFVNGQNYYPHDLEAIAQRAHDLELGKVVAAGCRPAGAESDELTFFILHRGSLAEFLPLAAEVTRLVNEHAGLEVAHVVPVKRIPKTTSGKIQRVQLERAFVAGEFAAELAELSRLREAKHTHGAAGQGVQARIKEICDAALPGKRVELDDNLFEIGASSLTLIQIHEEIDKLYPGLVDLTELFDFPTVAELAKHLESKLAAGGS
jgi:acyl-CoA synthetase (AMP-forming)/AMP-acid ligase II/acyl carrier protein